MAMFGPHVGPVLKHHTCERENCSHGTQFVIAYAVYNFLALNSAKFQANVTLDKVQKISNRTVVIAAFCF